VVTLRRAERAKQFQRFRPELICDPEPRLRALLSRSLEDQVKGSDVAGHDPQTSGSLPAGILRAEPTDLVQRLVQPVWYRIGTILSCRKSLSCKDL